MFVEQMNDWRGGFKGRKLQSDQHIYLEGRKETSDVKNNYSKLGKKAQR